MGYTGPDHLAGGGASARVLGRRRSEREIGIVLFEGFSLLAVGVIPEVFQLANELYAPHGQAAPMYDVRFFSAAGGRVACSSSISVWTYACDARSAFGFDALFIADGQGAQRAAQDERVIRWLRDVLPLCDVVKAIGMGRVLFEAASAGGSRYLPAAELDANGAYAWAQRQQPHEAEDRHEPAKTALMVVRRDLGLDVAREIAGRLSLGGASVLTPLFSHGGAITATEKVRASAQWLKDNCERPISVSDAVRVAAMSERNFLRCFKQEMGITPSEFLLQARLEMTSRMLAQTDLPIDKVARRCGWVNGDRLAKIFRKRMALTPSEYRIRSRSQVLDDDS